MDYNKANIQTQQHSLSWGENAACTPGPSAAQAQPPSLALPKATSPARQFKISGWHDVCTETDFPLVKPLHPFQKEAHSFRAIFWEAVDQMTPLHPQMQPSVHRMDRISQSQTTAPEHPLGPGHCGNQPRGTQVTGTHQHK